jgi:predicted RNA binding protein YcfA (HicA-like mRNA interferase family)
MPPLPVLTPAQVLKTFQQFGWTPARQRGSHIILTKIGHVATLSVPNHAEVARGTLRALIARAGLTVEAFAAQIDR